MKESRVEVSQRGRETKPPSQWGDGEGLTSPRGFRGLTFREMSGSGQLSLNVKILLVLNCCDLCYAKEMNERGFAHNYG